MAATCALGQSHLSCLCWHLTSIKVTWLLPSQCELWCPLGILYKIPRLGSWRESSTSKLLILQAWGPEFEYQFSHTWLCVVVCSHNPSTGETETGRSLGLSSQPVSVNWWTPCVRDPITKAKKDGSQGTTLKVDLWLPPPHPHAVFNWGQNWLIHFSSSIAMFPNAKGASSVCSWGVSWSRAAMMKDPQSPSCWRKDGC